MDKTDGQIFYLTDNEKQSRAQRQVLRKSDQRNLIRSDCRCAPFVFRIGNGCA